MTIKIDLLRAEDGKGTRKKVDIYDPLLHAILYIILAWHRYVFNHKGHSIYDIR